MASASTSMDRDTGPWYREPWPWILMAFPATAVVVGIAFLTVSIKTDDGQVISDYYRQGRVVHESVARIEHARALGLEAQVIFGDERIRIDLSAANPADVPTAITLTLARPAQGDQDQHLLLTGYGGRFEGALAPLGYGHWRIYLEDESRTWRLNGAAYLPAEPEVRILPPEPVQPTE